MQGEGNEREKVSKKDQKAKKLDGEKGAEAKTRQEIDAYCLSISLSVRPASHEYNMPCTL